MITEEQAVDGTEVIFDNVRQTVIQGKPYQDPELGLMVKTALYPGDMPATKYELAKPEAPGTEVAKVPKPVIVFKGKLIGETEETEITPALIEEKSKPLLALKITGILDNEGAEAVKAAIQKAVKMRTLVEKQEEPEIKRVNAAAKQRVADIREISGPIYAACKKTQDALQLTYDTWSNEVAAAKKKEDDAYREKTEGREKKMFTVGFTWNGEVFLGYGRSYAKEYLHNLPDVTFFELIGELEGLQMEQAVTGKNVAEPSNESPKSVYTPGSAFRSAPPVIPPVGKMVFPSSIYDKTLPDGTRILLTQGEIPVKSYGEGVFLVSNDRVKQSSIYVQVIK